MNAKKVIPHSLLACSSTLFLWGNTSTGCGCGLFRIDLYRAVPFLSQINIEVSDTILEEAQSCHFAGGFTRNVHQICWFKRNLWNFCALKDADLEQFLQTDRVEGQKCAIAQTSKDVSIVIWPIVYSWDCCTRRDTTSDGLFRFLPIIKHQEWLWALSWKIYAGSNNNDLFTQYFLTLLDHINIPVWPFEFG